MNKGQDVQTIVHAIRMVLDGGVYLSPRMLQWFTGCALTRETVEMGHPLLKLSPRELQVFEMLGRGLDIKEIAGQLSLDHKTVELTVNASRPSLASTRRPQCFAPLFCGRIHLRRLPDELASHSLDQDYGQPVGRRPAASVVYTGVTRPTPLTYTRIFLFPS